MTTNQARHCYTRYCEYHKCIAQKGEDAEECGFFQRAYRSLCPGDWLDRWNEQREVLSILHRLMKTTTGQPNLDENFRHAAGGNLGWQILMWHPRQHCHIRQAWTEALMIGPSEEELQITSPMLTVLLVCAKPDIAPVTHKGPPTHKGPAHLSTKVTPSQSQ